MEHEEAALLISKALDGEANPDEKRALEEAAQASVEIRELLDQMRAEHRSLLRISELREETLLEEEALHTAFANVATRARAEARTLRSLEPSPGRAKNASLSPASLWDRIFRPLPNFAGALAGAAIALGGVLLLSAPGQLSTIAPGVSETGTYSGEDFGPTRGGPNTADEKSLQQVVDRLQKILASENPDYTSAMGVINHFRTAHPEALAACTCDVYKFHVMASRSADQSGYHREAGKSLIAAGQCLKLDPCSVDTQRE